MRYERTPDPAWYERWEPYDTMVAPVRYVNAVVGAVPHGYLAIAEPWLAEGNEAPLDRTLLGYATHESLVIRAAARVGGGWFNTRVAFVGGAKPNEVRIGDVAWDADATTYAMTEHHARQAFHAPLRRMLLAWRFRGHIELRTGGVVLNVAGLRPRAEDYDRLAEFLAAVVANAVAHPQGA